MSTIDKFTLVQIVSSLNDKPSIQAWDPSAYEQPGLATAHKLLGMTMTDSDFGEPVACMKRGYIRGVSDGSETWAVGDILWANNAGAATNVRPDAPLPLVVIGTVFLDEGGGLWTVHVDLRVLPSLGELSGVSVETPADKDVFIYKSSTNVWEPRQLDHGADLADLEKPLDHPMYQRKHGFEVAADGTPLVTMSYDKTTRVVTITPVGATFSFWIDGVRFTKTGAQAASAHANSTGKHFVIYDAAGALQVSTTAWSVLNRAVTPVALVYYNTTMADGWCFYEGHTADRTLEQHYHDHFSEGTKYISGGALTGYTVGAAGESNAGVTMAIASATIADEDIVRVLSAVADGGPYMTLYRSGASGEWLLNDTRTLPYEYDAGANFISYNNPNAGGAGVWGLTSIGSGNFVPYFLCATTGVASARQFFFVPAQAVTGTLASALLYTITNIAWGTVPFEEFVPLYRIIFRSGASYASTGRARIEQIDAISSSATATLPGTPTVHNALSGRDVADTHPATSIGFTPYGTIAATDVQTAIQELLDESAAPVLALDDLTDVNAPSPADGDVLTWIDGASEWQPASASAVVASLDAIGDVNVPAPSAGDVLTWDDTPGEWIASPAGTPGAHATSHEFGGGDPIQLDDLAAPDDNTDLDASITAHGLLRKLSNVASEYLDGTGAWSTPAGASALDDLTDVNAPAPDDGDVLTWDDGAGEWVPMAAGAPGDHASTHSEDGSDEILVEDLGSAETDTSKRLAPDGTGGLAWASGGGGGGNHVLRFAVSDPAPGNSLYPLLISPYAGTVVKVQAIRVGSGSVDVDVEVDGSEIVGTDLTVGTTWTASGTLAAAVVVGDTIAVSLKSVVSPIGYLVVQVEFEES